MWPFSKHKWMDLNWQWIFWSGNNEMNDTLFVTLRRHVHKTGRCKIDTFSLLINNKFCTTIVIKIVIKKKLIFLLDFWYLLLIIIQFNFVEKSLNYIAKNSVRKIMNYVSLYSTTAFEWWFEELIWWAASARIILNYWTFLLVGCCVGLTNTGRPARAVQGKFSRFFLSIIAKKSNKWVWWPPWWEFGQRIGKIVVWIYLIYFPR